MNLRQAVEIASTHQDCSRMSFVVERAEGDGHFGVNSARVLALENRGPDPDATAIVTVEDAFRPDGLVFPLSRVRDFAIALTAEGHGPNHNRGEK